MTSTKAWIPDVQLRLTDALSPITLRDHQVAACEALSRHFLDRGKQAGVVVIPTGGGKTAVATDWLLKHHIRDGGRVLWLAHRRSLLRQAFRTFRWLGNAAYPKKSLGLIAISSDDCSWSMVTREHDVVFSSMQSAVRTDNMDFVETFLDDSEQGVCVVVDEAHQLRGREDVGDPVAGSVDGHDLKAHAGPVVQQVRREMDAVRPLFELEPGQDRGRTGLDVLVPPAGPAPLARDDAG